jgi:hypothetical protein
VKATLGAETKAMKHRNLLMFVLVAMAMIPLAPAASAHHSFAAEYDANRPVTLTGSVTKMAWINPHSWIYIDVKRPDGNVENWAVEAGTSGHADKSGVHEGILGCRHCDRGERLPRKRRGFASEWARCHVAGRAIALRRRIEPRRTKVRKREYKANTVPAFLKIIEEAQHA